MSLKTRKVIDLALGEGTADYYRCRVCGNTYNRTRWRRKIMGKHVCAWCMGRGAKALIPILIYTEKMSELPCEKPVKALRADGLFDWGPAEGCKCKTCTARKVYNRYLEVGLGARPGVVNG